MQVNVFKARDCFNYSKFIWGQLVVSKLRGYFTLATHRWYVKIYLLANFTKLPIDLSHQRFLHARQILLHHSTHHHDRCGVNQLPGEGVLFNLPR